jgi:hypothetical protein
MVIDNTKSIRRIRKGFYLGAAFFALLSLAFFLLQQDIAGFILATVVIVWFFIFQSVDFRFVHFETGNSRIILKYYQAVRFGSKEYKSIEFPERTLQDYRFEKSVMGLVYDLVLVVKTKRGSAEYPPVSFAAVSKTNRLHIEKYLRTLLNR